MKNPRISGGEDDPFSTARAVKSLSYLLEPADAPLQPALLQVGSDLRGDVQPCLGVVGDVAHKGKGLVGLGARQKVIQQAGASCSLGWLAAMEIPAHLPLPASESQPLPCCTAHLQWQQKDRGPSLWILTFRMTLSTSVPTGAYRILGLLVIRCTRRPKFRCSLLVKPRELMLPCFSASGSMVLQRQLCFHSVSGSAPLAAGSPHPCP